MLDTLTLSLRILRGNLAAALKYAAFQALLFAFVLLSVCAVCNLNGAIENDYIQSPERRTVVFSCAPTLDVKQVTDHPLVQSAERKADRVVVVLRRVGDKQAVSDFMNRLDCWEYVDDSAADTSDLYRTVEAVFRWIAGLTLALGGLLFVLFLYRSVRGESEQLRLLRTLGFTRKRVLALTVTEQGILYTVGFLLGCLLMEILKKIGFENILAALLKLPSARLQTPASALGVLFLAFFCVLFLGCAWSVGRLCRAQNV